MHYRKDDSCLSAVKPISAKPNLPAACPGQHAEWLNLDGGTACTRKFVLQDQPNGPSVLQQVQEQVYKPE